MTAWAGGMAQAVACLLSKSSNPNTAKKKKKKGWVLVAHTYNPHYL
jgi:hypothetical protein